MTTSPQLSRRGFLTSTSAMFGGIAVGFHIPFGEEAQAQAALPPEVNAWVVVKPDDSVVIRIARSEMGQGSRTGLAQLVAEELQCDWTKVTTEYPTPGQNLARGRVWGSFATGGSRGIRDSQEYIRKGGAAARDMLIRAAAQQWGVPAGECTALKGVVTHAASGRNLRYGQLAQAAAKLPPPQQITLKDPKDWTIAGQRLPRLDTADKTTGKKIFGADLKLPGMLNAAIIECPVFGGRLKGFDAARAQAMPGVRHVLKVGETAVAVVAERWWQAKTALEAVKIDWDFGPHAAVTSQTIAEKLRAGLDKAEAFVGHRRGDAPGALAGAAKTVSATYAYPYQNHATMEPMNATALWTPERCEVWTPTQNGEAALATAAQAAGLPPEKCDVNKIDLGGGFGRRGASDFVRQAVLIARQIPGTPVKLLWSREEDMAQGRYHPVTMAKFEAGLDAGGNVVAMHMRISGQSIRASFSADAEKTGDPGVFQGLNAQAGEGQFGYAIPHLLIDHAMHNPHVPPGFWRGVNLNQNAIYLESFIDELAHAAGQDPLAFRRKMMAPYPKHLAVLNAVATRIGWDTPPPSGQHRGIAQINGFGSYVAAAAEISVSPKGVLKIHRIVCATDPGHAVNPQQIEAQVEGSFVYGLSALLHGEITVKDGRIAETNFDSYNVLRMDEMPKVEAIVMPSGGFWGGVGEPTIAVAAPAVLNGIFAATGKRIRSFPLKNARLGQV